MSVIVRIPTALRKITADQDRVPADGASLAECVDSLEASYPGLKERLCDESGEIRRFVNIYVNGEDVRFLQGLATSLKDGAEVSIVPAVAGGGRSATELATQAPPALAVYATTYAGGRKVWP